jgi:hypothetical protein
MNVKIYRATQWMRLQFLLAHGGEEKYPVPTGK